MSDSDSSSGASTIPSWQRGDNKDQEERLTVARRFLEDEAVKDAPHEKKVEFLKSKEVSDDDIQKLLGDKPESTEQATTQPTTPAAKAQPKLDRAPVVTYPEFLTKPERLPPLVTTNGLLATLYGFAGLSTIVYGASKYVVAPMVDSLNESRSDFQETTSSKLDQLVAQLEKTVSILPPPPASSQQSQAVDAAEEKDEDPAEMFHRDIGTQTSLPATPNAAAEKKEPAALTHANQLGKLTRWTAGLRDDVRAQTSSFADMQSQIDNFRNELDTMTYAQNDFTNSSAYEMFGGPKKNEPNDEIRKARDNIRRIKGVLLSTRSFPASTR